MRPEAPSAAPRMEHQVSLADGGTIRAWEMGEGAPLLLIHGTGGDTWLDCVSHLARRHRVIGYDRRGFGGSTPIGKEGYLARQVEDAASVVDRLIGTRVTVVGHSWGGIVALGLTARSPEFVSRLVLIQPPFHAKKHMTPSLFVTFMTVQLLRRTRGPRAATEFFMRWVTGCGPGKSSYDRLPTAARERILGNAAGVVTELDAGTGEEISEDTVARIAAPALLLQGDLSQPVLRRLAAHLARLLPNATVKGILGAGHLLHFDQPDQFERAVAAE